FRVNSRFKKSKKKKRLYWRAKDNGDRGRLPTHSQAPSFMKCSARLLELAPPGRPSRSAGRPWRAMAARRSGTAYQTAIKAAIDLRARPMIVIDLGCGWQEDEGIADIVLMSPLRNRRERP
ncbi:MAG: hypothetical protein NTX50_22785, partial [Candidatus Sumerlaeota bacterium]|nr:hypothetical protein [Candidatus Sumerlaeota bacterium]